MPMHYFRWIEKRRQAGAKLFFGRDSRSSQRIGLSASIGSTFIFFEEFYNGREDNPYFEPGFDAMFFYSLTY